jgi:hypothetical protein
MRSSEPNAQQNFESHWLAVNLCRLEWPVLQRFYQRLGQLLFRTLPYRYLLELAIRLKDCRGTRYFRASSAGNSRN